VKWTAQDAVGAGFKSYFIWDLTWPVESDHDSQVRDALQSHGVEIVTADMLSGAARGLERTG
jgi:nicotinamidase/pyrazinamidase